MQCLSTIYTKGRNDDFLNLPLSSYSHLPSHYIFYPLIFLLRPSTLLYYTYFVIYLIQLLKSLLFVPFNHFQIQYYSSIAMHQCTHTFILVKSFPFETSTSIHILKCNDAPTPLTASFSLSPIVIIITMLLLLIVIIIIIFIRYNRSKSPLNAFPVSVACVPQLTTIVVVEENDRNELMMSERPYFFNSNSASAFH